MRALMLFRLALRDLVRQRRRTAMALFILASGVLAVLFTRGWQTGMLDLIEREGAGTWLGAVQVQPPDTLEIRDALALEPNLEVTDELFAAVRDDPRVREVSPRLRFFGQLFNEEESGPFFGLAIDQATAKKVVPRLLADDRLVSGRHMDPKKDDEILVASPLADALGLSAGDRATVLVRPVDGGLEGADVTVVGVLQAAFEENQKRAVIVDLRLARRLLRMEGRATQLLVDTEPLAAAREVARALPARVSSVTKVEANPWDEINTRYQAARVIWATSLGVMLLLVVLVGALGLSTTMLLLVAERVTEIGTLAALGLRRRTLVSLFVLESVLLGAIGGLIGCASAVGLTRMAAARGIQWTPPGGYLVTVRPTLDALDLSVAMVVVVTLSALVVLPLAWRAARRAPSEVLR